jgi:alkanesulfonate monooxygenase SsuD/methylene tetrahydromethanopterin reductase-like flavin-dependent oxidoreductase (luciferase family)
MWSGEEKPFEGTHYQLARTLNSPNALQQPHPPILVGGGGEAKTLRLVARYADMCNLFDLPGSGFDQDLRHKLDVLRRHCEAIGRDDAEISKTVSSFVDLGDDHAADVRSLVDHVGDLAAIGFDHVFLAPRRPWDDAGLQSIAGALDELHAL